MWIEQAISIPVLSVRPLIRLLPHDAASAKQGQHLSHHLTLVPEADLNGIRRQELSVQRLAGTTCGPFDSPALRPSHGHTMFQG